MKEENEYKHIISIEKLISRLETDLKLAQKHEAKYGKSERQYQKKNLKSCQCYTG